MKGLQEPLPLSFSTQAPLRAGKAALTSSRSRSSRIGLWSHARRMQVYAALNAKIAGSSKLVQMLFKWGLASGESNFNRGVVGANWLYNKLVFKKVQALLGGRLVFAGTGSAPLSPKVFASAALP
eukprot:4474450-Pleurochrysis_carterae.AAC.3